MKFKNIIKHTPKPILYEKGTAVMWTDEHISKQLLQVHLNTEVDLASRKQASIEQTCKWILDQAPKKKLKVLDLGCGPGLYAELFAQQGHEVTGVDFSMNSIEYARKEAKTKVFEIEYIQANYLELELEEKCYDLVILIFTDLGVLLPAERERMLQFVHKILKPGGTFIFDVLKDKKLAQKVAPKNWEIVEHGFWKAESYIALSESFLYKNEKVILYQHILMDETEKVDIYRFWTHFFSHSDLESIVKRNGFEEFTFHENVLPIGNLWNGDNVTFTVAVK